MNASDFQRPRVRIAWRIGISLFRSMARATDTKATAVVARGGHWGILETAKPEKKNHPKPQSRQKIRPKPKTEHKTVKKPIQW